MFTTSDTIIFAMFCVTLIVLVLLSSPRQRADVVSKVLQVLGTILNLVVLMVKRFLLNISVQPEPPDQPND